METQTDVRGLERDLGSVEGKLDLILAHIKASDERHAALEPRVRSVENKLLYFSGAAAAASFILAKVDFTKIVAVAHAAGLGG
jgi:hypothetical protein